MNNKGQTLVIFVILIPVFILIGAFMVDSAYISIEKIKLDDVTEIVANNLIENNLTEEQAKNLVLANDDKIFILKLNTKDDQVSIHLQKKIDSIFGSLIGYENYEINSMITIKD